MVLLNWSYVGVLFNIVIYTILIILLKPYYNNPNLKLGERPRIIFFFFIIFCLLPLYSPDTFAYYGYYLLIQQGASNVPIEQVYFDIISTTNSFITFRLIVWGGASILIWYTLVFIKIGKGPFFLFFIGVFILKYAYARVYLAFALIFIGLALYYIDKKSVLFKFFGIVTILSAIFFHKSAGFGVILVLIIIFLPNIKRNYLRLFFISYPFLIIAAKIVIANFFDAGFDTEDDVQNSAFHHLNSDNREVGIGKLIENVLTRFPFYMSVYLYYKMVSNGKLSKLPISLQKFATASFFIVCFSTVFAFNLGYNTDVFYYRLLHFSIIPVSVFLGYLYQNKYRFKLLRITWTIGFIGCIYSFLYTLYNSII